MPVLEHTGCYRLAACYKKTNENKKPGRESFETFTAGFYRELFFAA